jgi:hypothetical protein
LAHVIGQHICFQWKDFNEHFSVDRHEKLSYQKVQVLNLVAAMSMSGISRQANNDWRLVENPDNEESATDRTNI